MPDDRKRNGDTRFAYTLSHLQQAPSLNMAFGYNIRYASDNDYFRDFGDRRAIADGANLLREGWANWHSPFGFSPSRPSATKPCRTARRWWMSRMPVCRS